ncbi:glutamine amidotransferase class-I, partial [Sistotremastrum niveocremeum HHB9708]
MAPVRIAVLTCDLPIPAVIREFGDYLEIYTIWLRNSLKAGLGDTVDPDSNFIVHGYDVRAMQYPDLNEYDGVIITGSSASAYDPLPWISKLVAFMSDCVQSHPRITIVGICFGHQIMARALGGSAVPNNDNWELGVYEVPLSKFGQEFFGVSTLNIQQVHRDHVPQLPPGSNIKLLGSTRLTPIQGFVLSRPDSSTQILTLQGHPEINSRIVQHIVDARGPNGSGVINASTSRSALERATRLHDGVEIIGVKVLIIL